jgi:hypothetical protein
VKKIIEEMIENVDHIHKFSQKVPVLSSMPIFVICNGVKQDIGDACSFLLRKKITPDPKQLDVIRFNLDKIQGVPLFHVFNFRDKEQMIAIIKVKVIHDAKKGMIFIRALNLLVGAFFLFLLDEGVDLDIGNIHTSKELKNEENLNILTDLIEEIVGCMNYKGDFVIKPTDKFVDGKKNKEFDELLKK